MACILGIYVEQRGLSCIHGMDVRKYIALRGELSSSKAVLDIITRNLIRYRHKPDITVGCTVLHSKRVDFFFVWCCFYNLYKAKLACQVSKTGVEMLNYGMYSPLLWSKKFTR